MFIETPVPRQRFIETPVQGYRCDPFRKCASHGTASSALYKAILQPRLFWVWWGPWGLSQRAMAGVRGRSGGRRAGAGRRPSATQIKKPTSKGIQKALKSGQSTPDANVKKLTAFFSTTSAAPAAAPPENVRTLPSTPGPQPSCLLALLPLGLGLGSLELTPPLVLCSCHCSQL